MTRRTPRWLRSCQGLLIPTALGFLTGMGGMCPPVEPAWCRDISCAAGERCSDNLEDDVDAVCVTDLSGQPCEDDTDCLNEERSAFICFEGACAPRCLETYECEDTETCVGVDWECLDADECEPERLAVASRGRCE